MLLTVSWGFFFLQLVVDKRPVDNHAPAHAHAPRVHNKEGKIITSRCFSFVESECEVNMLIEICVPSHSQCFPSGTLSGLFILFSCRYFGWIWSMTELLWLNFSYMFWFFLSATYHSMELLWYICKTFCGSCSCSAGRLCARIFGSSSLGLLRKPMGAR